MNVLFRAAAGFGAVIDILFSFRHYHEPPRIPIPDDGRQND